MLISHTFGLKSKFMTVVVILLHIKTKISVLLLKSYIFFSNSVLAVILFNLSSVPGTVLKGSVEVMICRWSLARHIKNTLKTWVTRKFSSQKEAFLETLTYGSHVLLMSFKNRSPSQIFCFIPSGLIRKCFSLL